MLVDNDLKMREAHMGRYRTAEANTDLYTLMATPIAGAYEVQPALRTDCRGSFVKAFHAPTFAACGLETDFAESFYSISTQRVLRGLHFQRPPHDYAKLVYCPSGSVLDVMVDLRRSSPSYGTHLLTVLSGERANMRYLPRGVAHGFYVLSEQAITAYMVSAPHVPWADDGILWNSAGIPWPDADPILSSRDHHLLPFAELGEVFV